MNDEFDDLTNRVRHSLDGRGAGPALSPDLVRGAAVRTEPHLANPRRRLQVAGGLTLAVAAIAVGALVITSPFQRSPLFVAAGDGGVPPLGSSEDTVSSDLRIANWIDYQYVPGAGLSTNGGSGSVYQLKLSGSPQQTLENAARALGLVGEVEKSQYFDEAYPSYVIGPEDGTAASLVVSWSGTGNWWYSDPAAYPPLECETAPSAGEGDVAPDGACTVPEPDPADSLAPSESEARAAALALFTATGLDVSADDIRVTIDPWQTVATANLRVDGVTTALDWSVAWSPNGKIAWAYGQSITVVDRGEYGTVSAADAVGRLADWRWYGSAGPDFQGGVNIYAADDTLAARDGATGSEDPAEGPTTDTPTPDSPTDPAEPGVDPAPEESPVPDPGTEPEPEPTVEPHPEPTPEVVVVEVNEAQKTLLLMWDSKGNAWLVPGFAMKHPDGWWNTVVSLVDGVIQLPEPMPIEPFLEDDGSRILQ